MPRLRRRAARRPRSAAWPGARVAHPRRRLPRRRQGDGVLRRVRAARRARRGAAPSRSPPTRSTTTRELARARLRAVGRRRRSTRRDRAGRPRRVPRARPARPARACARSSTVAASSTARASPRPASALRRIGARLEPQALERGDDARAGAPVAVELRARRPAACARAPRSAASRVEVDEHVPAGVDGLDPLGRVAQRHARHAGEVGLLLHAAGVGQHRARAARAAP